VSAPGRPLVESRTGSGGSDASAGTGTGAGTGTVRASGDGRGLGIGRRLGRAVVAVLPAWVVSRVIVLVALAIAHLSVSTFRPHNVAVAERVHQGLLSWDAGWYESIAAHGYVATGTESVRFFPGFPMLARSLTWLPGMTAGTAVIIVANLATLGALAGLGVLVRRDLGDAALARRSVWLLALAPPAYTFVLGYADSLLLLLAVATLLAIRRHRWWWAVPAAFAAGLVRPVGALLVVPIVIEVVRDEWVMHAAPRTNPPMPPTSTARGRWADVMAKATAVVAPLAGAGWYLAWVGAQFGDALLPFRVQQEQGHRGPITAPISSMWHNAVSVLHGHHVGSALHIPWVVLCLVLLVLAYRRLPVSYAAFATVVLAVSLTSSNLDSFERYALGAFPLVIAASTLTSRRRVEVIVLVLSGGAMAAYALAAFFGLVVP
jgi:hypothetical protein